MRSPPSVEAELTFTHPEHVDRDTQFPALLRAAHVDDPCHTQDHLHDLQRCRIHDCDAPGAEPPDLRRRGFDHLDLSSLTELQALFRRVRDAGELTDVDAAEIRRQMTGASLPLASGARLRVLYVAPEGLFMRRAGPNGLRVNSGDGPAGRNGHDAATSVHADQDVEGTPVRQILRRMGPWLFHHDSPLRSNARSPVFLLNVWIPLAQVTRPLALMDGRTLDRRRHQLRYGLPTEGILERDGDRTVNDIWTFLHHPDQRWYFSSQMGPERGYVFDTLSAPHGSFALPGEELAEARYLRLDAVRRALAGEGPAAAAEAASALEPWVNREDLTAPLRQALQSMDALLEQARAGQLEGWSDRAAAAMERVVRRSLEMRAVAWVSGTPR